MKCWMVWRGLSTVCKRLSPDLEVMVRVDAPVKGKVGLISGGGSGRATHAGFVGPGCWMRV